MNPQIIFLTRPLSFWEQAGFHLDILVQYRARYLVNDFIRLSSFANINVVIDRGDFFACESCMVEPNKH